MCARRLLLDSRGELGSEHVALLSFQVPASPIIANGGDTFDPLI